MHVFRAAWNRAEFVSMPLSGPGPICMLLPLLTGSGKSGIPCERMHSANFRPLDMAAAIMAGLITPKPLCFLHAAAADLNWGELVSIPLGILKPTPFASA